MMYPSRLDYIVCDITSIELLESRDGVYLIAADIGFTDNRMDEISAVYKSVFTARLEDGVLFIEAVDKGEEYTYEQLQADPAPEDRRWISEMYKLSGDGPMAMPFEEELAG